MSFDLPPEYLELQATVRKLAQEKVAPRAREIDTDATYPQDLFELFRDTGPARARRSRRSTAAAGAGILGLTVAIEEVAKYSNTAALMLLLTRLPTGPVLIAGSEEQKQQYVRGRRDRRAARRLRALGAAGRQRRGRHAHQGRARRRRLGAQRHQVLDVGRRAGRLVLRVRQDRPGRLAQARRHLVLHRRALVAGRLGRPHRRQDGRARRRHRRAHPRRRARPGRERRRRGRRLPARDARPQLDAARSSRRAASASPRAR